MYIFYLLSSCQLFCHYIIRTSLFPVSKSSFHTAFQVSANSLFTIPLAFPNSLFFIFQERPQTLNSKDSATYFRFFFIQANITISDSLIFYCIPNHPTILWLKTVSNLLLILQCGNLVRPQLGRLACAPLALAVLSCICIHFTDCLVAGFIPLCGSSPGLTRP